MNRFVRRTTNDGRVYYDCPDHVCGNCGKEIPSYIDWCEECIKKSSDKDFAAEECQ